MRTVKQRDRRMDRQTWRSWQ